MVMQAWRADRLGAPMEVLALDHRAAGPSVGGGQIKVRVRSVALNFPDVLMLAGQYQDRPPLPFIPGIEFCGDVLEIGSGAGGFEVGQRVMGGALLPWGALADQALALPEHLRPAPAALSDEQAASYTVAYQTGWMALVHRGRLAAGETLLVHAAAGGVGSAAIAIGKALGARVVGVVGGVQKAEIARRLGADVVIDRHEHTAFDSLVGALKQAVGAGGADVVFDPVGGESFLASTKVIGFEGRLLVIGFAGGSIPTLAANHVLMKNYSVVGVLWGAYRGRRPDLIARGWDDLDALLAGGMAPPYVSEVLPMSGAAEGLAALAEGRTTGRVVVDVMGR
jgi:NADPH:quinone reductase